MTQLNVPVDIADAVRAELESVGVNACCRPLPRDLEGSLPLTLVEPIGGGERRAHVIDRFPVRLSTYADTSASAIKVASLAFACIEACVGRDVGDVRCYKVSSLSLPYDSTDPRHPDLARVLQTCHLWVRANTIEQQ